MDLAASLPRRSERLDMRYQWIKRLLANDLVDSDAVMVAARVGGRALPLAWRVKQTRGAIGFAEQRPALDAVAGLLPAGVRTVLMGDRFYGGPELITWCRGHGWDWRLRLKQDLLVFEDDGETTLAACFRRGAHRLTGIGLTEKRVLTNVAMVHEHGHPEPWIIALSAAPTSHRAFDYGLRWGIEAMFSDFKTRGFGLADSHIRLPERLDHLILVMALALYWAVSTGMGDAAGSPTPAEKNSPANARETMPEPSPRSSPEASDASRPASNAPGPYHPSGAPGQTDSW